MARRTLLKLFALANNAYINANVTFYEVDTETNERTSTLATLYSNISGTDIVPNPYDLDSEGKFSTPVYHDAPIVAVINDSPVGTHETGIVFPFTGTWRGTWETDTVYFPNDQIKDGANGANTGNIYIATVEHESGVWADDLTAAKFELVVDVASVVASSAQASADAAAAAASASAASTSAGSAATSATASATASKLTPETVAGTTYTLDIGDVSKILECTNGSAITVTIPPNSSVAFDTGAQVAICQAGAGQVTIAAGVGVTLKSKYSRVKSEAQEAIIYAVKVAADTWRLAGDLVA